MEFESWAPLYGCVAEGEPQHAGCWQTDQSVYLESTTPLQIQLADEAEQLLGPQPSLPITTTHEAMVGFLDCLGQRMGSPYIDAPSLYFVVLLQLFGTLPGQQSSKRKVSEAQRAVLNFLLAQLTLEKKHAQETQFWTSLLSEEMGQLKAAGALPRALASLSCTDTGRLSKYVNYVVSDKSGSSGTLSQLLALERVYAKERPFRIILFHPSHSEDQHFQRVLPRQDNCEGVCEVLIAYVPRDWLRGEDGARTPGAPLILNHWVGVNYPEAPGAQNSPRVPQVPAAPRPQQRKSVGKSPPPPPATVVPATDQAAGNTASTSAAARASASPRPAARTTVMPNPAAARCNAASTSQAGGSVPGPGTAPPASPPTVVTNGGKKRSPGREVVGGASTRPPHKARTAP